MTKYWITGVALILAVATLKTWLVVGFVLNSDRTDLGTVSALFVLFVALTSAVAYLCTIQVSKYITESRKQRLLPGAGEPAAKETVIARYAPDWGLSQAETDVAIFVAKGFSNSEVAEMRGCAIATVKTQLSSIYSKSGLGSRYQLIAFVTDEICAVANDDSSESDGLIPTQKVLPLVGRNARFDQETLRA